MMPGLTPCMAVTPSVSVGALQLTRLTQLTQICHHVSSWVVIALSVDYLGHLERSGGNECTALVAGSQEQAVARGHARRQARARSVPVCQMY